MAKRVSSKRPLVTGKIYPKGGERPKNVKNILAYEQRRRKKPLTEQAWREAESDLAISKRRRPLQKQPAKRKTAVPGFPQEYSFKMKIKKVPADCLVDFKQGVAIVVIQHPSIASARVIFHLDPKLIPKGLSKAVINFNRFKSFENTYGDASKALSLVWKKALRSYSGS